MKLNRPLLNLFMWLTNPAAEIQTVRVRRNARFLSGLLIVLVFFGTVSALIQLLITPNFMATFIGIMAGVGLIAITYFISRTTYFMWAATLTIIITSMVVVVNFLNDPMDTSALSYMIIGIFIGSMFFSVRETMLIILLDMVALLFIPSLSDQIEFADIVAYQLFIIIFSALMFISYMHRGRLDQDRIVDLEDAYDSTLEGWARALELIDNEIEGHSRRVVDIIMRLAKEIDVSDEELKNIHRGALLHDIGKMGIPHEILLKTAPLSEDDWEIIRRHPKIAYELLYPIAYLRPALEIPYSHHERWDGTGYPQGLREEEIPLAARLFAVVDTYDALISNRPYRNEWSKNKAREYIADQSGKHFDPKCVELFLSFY